MGEAAKRLVDRSISERSTVHGSGVGNMVRHNRQRRTPIRLVTDSGDDRSKDGSKRRKERKWKMRIMVAKLGVLSYIAIILTISAILYFIFDK